MLKIAHLTYDMRIGGTEQVILNIVQGSWSNDIEHSIICLEDPLGPFGEQLKTIGIKIKSFQRKDGFDLNLLKRVRQYLKSEKIDILHCHQYTPWSYGTLASIGLSTRIIFTEHGRFYPDIKHSKRKWLNPILSFFTHTITSISQATKRALVEYEYLNAKNIQVIYNGIASVELNHQSIEKVKTELGLSKDCFVLGTVARFDPIKNHELMITAVAELSKQHNVHLVIVGDGETRDKLEQKINDLDIASHVTLTGYKTNAIDYIANFDLYLLTSFSEGTSMTLLEAMCISKPCVVTNVGGNPEVIKDNETGLVVESDNLEQLCTAIDVLITDKSKRLAFGIKAKERFLQQFESEQMNLSFAQLYSNLLKISVRELKL